MKKKKKKERRRRRSRRRVKEGSRQRLGDFSPGAPLQSTASRWLFCRRCGANTTALKNLPALVKTQNPLAGEVQGGSARGGPRGGGGGPEGMYPGNNLGQGGRLGYCSLFV